VILSKCKMMDCGKDAVRFFNSAVVKAVSFSMFGHPKTRYLELPNSPTIFGFCVDHLDPEDEKVWIAISYEEAVVLSIMAS